MSRTIITVDAEPAVVSELDRIAATLQIDRGEVVREALDSYIAWDADFRASVNKGIQEAKAGLLIEHSEVVNMIRSKQMTSSKRPRA